MKLLLILLIASVFRLNNLNWDSNTHIHPDERFLTMVGNGMRLPQNIWDYLSPHISTFNPTNIGYEFFVYGRFPLILNKIIAVLFNNDTYNAFTIQGRFLSAVADILVVFLVYKTIKLLFKNKSAHTTAAVERVALWGAFFYAIAVLPIQLSHFFAADSFLNLFMFASFYHALKKNIPLSAIFIGLAVASKITAVFILPLIIFFILAPNKPLKYSILHTLYFILIAYLTLRFADPYLFQNANFLDPRISSLFIQNLKTLKSFEGADVWYPPAIQWISKPKIVYSLINIAVFGVGLPYFILILIGIFYILKSKILNLKSALFWLTAFFLYQSTRFVQGMRYFLFIYPFLAIFAALGANWLIKNKSRFLVFSSYLLVFSSLIWPISFSSIYLRPHSRVQASQWIYKNIPSGSLILGESWDDPLPLSVKENYGKQFDVELLPVFDQDTNEKWQKIDELLQRGDYYVLSSNRTWGAIMSVPEKYPKMSKFYKELFEGKTQYKKIKEFTSYPNPCYMLHATCYIDDSWADENFTVFDHPKVMIFKKI